MTINYNVTGTERKRLADYIAGFLGCEKKYLGAPSFAYQVGYMTVSKDGTITFDDRADSEEIETLLEELEAEGFHAEPMELPAEAAEPTEAPAQEEAATPDEQTATPSETGATEPEQAEAAPQDEPEMLSVEVSFDGVNMGNLIKLLEAKGDLIKKALGLDDLPLEMHSDSVEFCWFEDDPDAETAKARSRFISALCEMSRTQKRITATAKEVDNEKYAFRCFLLRLGFIGNEYKAERKILLRNLTGSSAFKSGARKERPATEQVTPGAAEVMEDARMMHQLYGEDSVSPVGYTAEEAIADALLTYQVNCMA